MEKPKQVYFDNSYGDVEPEPLLFDSQSIRKIKVEPVKVVIEKVKKKVSFPTKTESPTVTEGKKVVGLLENLEGKDRLSFNALKDQPQFFSAPVGQGVSNVATQMSITSDSSGLKFANDEETPGNSQYYGTDGTGTKGWFQLTSSGGYVTADISLTNEAIVRGDGGAKGVQTTSVIIDDSNNVSGMTTLTLPNTGLHILDTNATHDLIIAPGSNLTADRTLTFATGDASRTVTISGDATISGTNTGTQTMTLTSDVTGSGTGTFATTLATVNLNVGSFGSSTSIPSITVNGKGLITAISGNAVIAPAGTLTGTELAANVVTSSLTAVGIIVSGKWNADVIELAYGGTNANLMANNGGVVYSSATGLAILASTATAGKILQSGASTTPSWSTSTYPSASGAAGKMLRADGTNNVYSTFTIPDTFAQGDLLLASTANTVIGLAKDTSTTRYLSNQGSNNNANWAQVNLSNGVTSTLGATNGGTGASTVTTGDLLYGSAANVWSKIAIGSNGLFLGVAAGIPSWIGAVDLTNNQTVGGLKTFTSIPVGPSSDPTLDNEFTRKAYVDAAVAGDTQLAASNLGTAVALPANTYNNGSSGVGATLTGNVNGALTVDGVLTTASIRVLVKNEAAKKNNGVYDVTTVGTAGTPYVLTRTTDFDTTAKVTYGSKTFVQFGDTLAATTWTMITAGSITMGTDPIVWTISGSAGAVYTASLGVQKIVNDFQANLLATGAITLSGDKLQIEVDNTTIEINTNALRVKDAGITNAKIANTTIDLTAKVTGILPPANGGTGVNTFGGTNRLLYTSAVNTLSSIVTANDGTLITSGSGVPSVSSTLPAVVQGNITTVGTIGTGTWQGTVVDEVYGGTGQSSVTQGDLLYGSATNTWSKLAKNASSTRYLSNQGTANNPSWSQINLANGVTGTLPAGNGGTGTTGFGDTNTVLFTTSANTLSSITTGNNGILITGGTGIPSISSTLPTAVQGNITSLGTIASGVWNGTKVGLGFGGTGTVLSNPGADTLFGWDNTDASAAFFLLGSGLSYDHGTHTLSASGSGGSGSYLAHCKATSITVELTTTETSINSFSLAGGSLGAGNVLRFTANLSLNGGSADGTFTVRLKYGGTTVGTVVLENHTIADTFYGQLQGFIMGAGTTSSQNASMTGSISNGVIGQSTNRCMWAESNGTATVDTTASQTAELTVQNSSTSISITIRNVVWEILRA